MQNQVKLEIKEVDDNHFDVFWDSGWYNWARVKNSNGFLTQVSGEPIPKPVFATLITMFKKGK